MKPLLSSLALMLLLPALHAQIITGLIVSSSTIRDGGPEVPYDISPSDPYWAQFGVSGTDATTSTSSVNVMAGASSAVTLGPLTQSGVDSYSTYTQYSSDIELVYSNGSSPASSTTNNAGEVSVASGYGGDSSPILSFTLTFNQAVSKGTLDLIANDYQATSTYDFTFSNNAKASVIDPHPALGRGNDEDVYTLSFSDVPMGSVLTVTDTMSLGYGNTSISGLAFTVLDVPEPSTWAMLLAGLAFLGFRMRGRSIFRA